jgi:hypothetical protein
MESVKSEEDGNVKKQMEIQRIEQELQAREELLAQKELDLELKMEILKRGQAELEDKQLKWGDKTPRSSRVEVELSRDMGVSQTVSSGSSIVVTLIGMEKERKGLFRLQVNWCQKLLTCWNRSGATF